MNFEEPLNFLSPDKFENREKRQKTRTKKEK
jgi:hypothetical protein